MAIIFHLDSGAGRLNQRKRIKQWIKEVIEEEKRNTGQINIILSTDAYLLKLNKKHLSKNYYTDIITFDYSEQKFLNGDLFISVERVRENAVKYGATEEEEMLRVIIHGILHLLGYDDSNDEEKKAMIKKEDLCLRKYHYGS